MPRSGTDLVGGILSSARDGDEIDDLEQRSRFSAWPRDNKQS